MKKVVGIFACAILLLASCSNSPKEKSHLSATTDDGDWFFLKQDDLATGAHHTRHAEIFGKYIDGYNQNVLRGIDIVQSSAMDGGGYFIGIKADPPESPVGYPLRLFGQPLLEPPRTSSYCSGATYSAFIEQLNLLFEDKLAGLSPERLEALRMQEPDGGRREDEVKFWGKWNDDGFGNHFALVQYSQMGTEIKPQQARPGDFMNISWQNGGGHSVIFLGWYVDQAGGKNVVYWSSQTRTNGFGDEVVPLDRIKSVKIVRLTDPEALYRFDVSTTVDDAIPGDGIEL